MIDITIDARMWGDNFGGIGRYVKEISLHLVKIQRDKQFCFIISSTVAEEIKKYDFENVSFLVSDAPIFSLAEQFFLVMHVPKCGIFWSPYINVPFLPIRAKIRVVTIHDVFHVVHPEYFSFIKRLIIKLYYNFSINKSDIILTVSEFSKREILTYFKRVEANKVEVIYNGCDIDKSQIQAHSCSFKYILFVGNIKPHKNIRNALLAFEALGATEFNFVIVGKREGFITGDDSIFPIIDRINLKEQRVVFTGRIEDNELYSFYKSASMLILPSFYEGFGLPLVEAMHFSLPIACSDIPVFHEIGGNEMVYFNPSDVDSIRSGILTALKFEGNVKYKLWSGWRETSLNVLKAFDRLL